MSFILRPSLYLKDSGKENYHPQDQDQAAHRYKDERVTEKPSKRPKKQIIHFIYPLKRCLGGGTRSPAPKATAPIGRSSRYAGSRPSSSPGKTPGKSAGRKLRINCLGPLCSILSLQIPPMNQYHVNKFEKLQNENCQEDGRYDYFTITHGLHYGENSIFGLNYILRDRGHLFHPTIG